MKALGLFETITALVKVHQPVLLWGRTGCGKSALMEQVAAELKIECITLNVAAISEKDLRITSHVLFSSDAKKGMVLLDNIHLATPETQVALTQLIQHNRINDMQLPHHWSVVATANSEDKFLLTPDFLNHFTQLEFDIAYEDWRAWAVKEGINSDIVSFLARRQELLYTFDRSSDDEVFATPRSWSFVHKALEAKLREAQLLDVIKGSIGLDNAIEFISYKNSIHDIPDIEQILEGHAPDSYPTELQALHVTVSRLVERARREKDKVKLNNILEYSMKIEAAFSVLLVRDLESIGIAVNKLGTYKRWMQQFSHLL